MLELILIVCLQTAPERCEEIYLPRGPSATVMHCMVDAQREAAAWTEQHPGYVVKRWKCGPPRA